MDVAGFVDTLQLNSYEKAAIVFLSSIESATATIVMKQANIPQGRIYSVLNGLASKGIVSIVPTTPKQYQIKDVVAVLHEYLEHAKADLERKQELLRTLEVRKTSSAVAGHSTVMFTGRDEHLQAITALRNAARKELLQIAPLFIGSFSSNLSLDRAMARGVTARIIIRGVTNQNRKAVMQAVAAGAKIRVSSHAGVPSLLIRDRGEVLFPVQDYSKEEERLALLSRNASLIATFTEQFEQEWKRSKPLRL